MTLKEREAYFFKQILVDDSYSTTTMYPNRICIEEKSVRGHSPHEYYDHTFASPHFYINHESRANDN